MGDLIDFSRGRVNVEQRKIETECLNYIVPETKIQIEVDEVQVSALNFIRMYRYGPIEGNFMDRLWACYIEAATLSIQLRKRDEFVPRIVPGWDVAPGPDVRIIHKYEICVGPWNTLYNDLINSFPNEGYTPNLIFEDIINHYLNAFFAILMI